jgi:hypothetical protein
MNKLKFIKKLILIGILLICLFLLVQYWYNHTNAEETYKVTTPHINQKLLIAAQSSPFKDSITAGVLEHYKSSTITLELIDVKTLANLDLSHFDAILLIYRWEAGAPPELIQSFMDKNSELKHKMVILVTSWNGLEKKEDVDALTGASILGDVPIFKDKIIKKLDRLLNYKE